MTERAGPAWMWLRCVSICVGLVGCGDGRAALGLADAEAATGAVDALAPAIDGAPAVDGSAPAIDARAAVDAPAPDVDARIPDAALPIDAPIPDVDARIPDAPIPDVDAPIPDAPIPDIDAPIPDAPTPDASLQPTDPCGGGPLIPKAGGGSWECTFDEEFDGDSLDTSKWVAQQTANSSFTAGPVCFVDSPNNVSVSGGALHLTVRKEAAPFTCVDPSGNFTTSNTSGSISTYHTSPTTGFSQAYGRFEIRARVPNVLVKGLQESFWLWPDNPVKYGNSWPASGEIDIAEIYHQYPDRAIPYIHYNNNAFMPPDPNVTNDYCMLDLSQFHTYVLEWTPDALTISFDGVVCLVDDWNPALPLHKPEPFDSPFIIALTQALGVTGNAFDPATTPLPATTDVDYVRVWK